MASARNAATTLERFSRFFKQDLGNVIGVIHVAALPGGAGAAKDQQCLGCSVRQSMDRILFVPGWSTPCSNNDVSKIIDEACREAAIYKDMGVDGVIVENMHDVPYLQASSVGPEVTAAMTAVCVQVKRLLAPSPVGVQILAGANRHAMAVAKAADLQFIRAEGFVFSHVADEGLMNACAGDLMRYRHSIGADNIMVLADIKKKHSAHAITADVDIVETARAAKFFLADGVVVTGPATGQITSTQEVKAVLQGSQMPVLVGSGVTPENYDQYRMAHAVIVGSAVKEGGHWANPLDAKRLKHLMDRVKDVRKKHVDATMII